LKHKPFPENPFLMAFTKIAIIDAVVMIVAIILSFFKSDWAWYIMGLGLLISMAVFTLLNKQCLKQLHCPHCKQEIAFEKGVGFVCQKCKTCWEMS